jgi:hypothetical protein
MSSKIGDNFEYFVRTYSAFIFKLIANCWFIINTILFYGIWMDMFFVKRQNVHTALHWTKCMRSSWKCCATFDEVLLFLSDKLCSLHLFRNFSSLAHIDLTFILLDDLNKVLCIDHFNVTHQDKFMFEIWIRVFQNTTHPQYSFHCSFAPNYFFRKIHKHETFSRTFLLS